MKYDKMNIIICIVLFILSSVLCSLRNQVCNILCLIIAIVFNYFENKVILLNVYNKYLNKKGERVKNNEKENNNSEVVF